MAFPPWLDPIYPIKDVDLSLNHGQVLGLVGQSGSGKSLTALAVIGMIPRPGKITNGSIIFEDTNLVKLTSAQYRSRRGRDMFLIFQGCGAALTPTMRIGRQIAEVYVHIHKVSWRKGLIAAEGALEKVRLEARVIRAYPFELSGGMRQRVLLAMAFAMQSKLIIADEPTTGLDMVTQAEILDIFADMKAKGRVSIILITHDMRVVGRLADEVAVMYEGEIVDHSALFCLPEVARHPHTFELLSSCRALSCPLVSC